MLAQLVVGLVVEAPDGGFLDRPVHPFDLAGGRGVPGLRIETPEDLGQRFGWPELGAADGPLKNAILGGNSAMLYKMTGAKTGSASVCGDRLADYKRLYQSGGEDRSNALYGFIHSSERQ